MTRQNRCTPWGQLRAAAPHGHWMGNRGILKAQTFPLDVVPFTSQCWLMCSLKGKGPPARFADGGVQYTKLFFLDEASGLAAGHRPCWECRPKQFKLFKAAWVNANSEHGLTNASSVRAIDRVLHTERVSGRTKRLYQAPVEELPDGTLFADGDDAYLVWKGGHRRWSFAGYAPPAASDYTGEVQVLTPPSIVRTLTAYRVQVHPSAEVS